MNHNKGNPKKSIREWLLENGSLYKSYKDVLTACVSDLKVTRHSVYKTAGKLRIKGVNILVKDGQESKIIGIGLSEQELRSKHDALYKIEQAVKLLISGKFVPEPEFKATVSIESSKFRSKSDLSQFDQYKGRVQGVIYWGNPKDIKRLKDEGVLS